MRPTSMATLSERLQQQLKTDQEAVHGQTTQLLQQHEQNLKKLSSDALSTTKNVMQRQLNGLSGELKNMNALTLNRLRWLMLWPLLASGVLSLVIVLSAMGWAWLTVSQVEAKEAQTLQKIQQVTARFCAEPAGRKACK